MKKTLTILFLFALLFQAKAIDSNAPQKGGDKKISLEISLHLYHENLDTAMYYIRGVAYYFDGKTLKDQTDTMIITIDTDSLDRAFYFFEKLGKVKKKKIKKTDYTDEYQQVITELEERLPEYEKLKKALLDAKFHNEALEAEKKYAPVEKKVMELRKRKSFIESKLNYIQITVVFKE